MKKHRKKTFLKSPYSATEKQLTMLTCMAHDVEVYTNRIASALSGLYQVSATIANIREEIRTGRKP